MVKSRNNFIEGEKNLYSNFMERGINYISRRADRKLYKMILTKEQVIDVFSGNN